MLKRVKVTGKNKKSAEADHKVTLSLAAPEAGRHKVAQRKCKE